MIDILWGAGRFAQILLNNVYTSINSDNELSDDNDIILLFNSITPDPGNSS